MEFNIDSMNIKLIPTLIYSEKINRKCIEKVLNSTSRKFIHILIDPERIIDYRQVIYSIYVSTRNREINIKMAKKLELDVLCYLCCTDKIRNVVEECVKDLEREVLLISYCINCDYEDLENEHRDIIERICEECNVDNVDLVICFSCYKNTEPPDTCKDVTNITDFMEKIVEIILERVE